MPTLLYKSADVQQTSETTVQVRRSFNAKQDLVFKAFAVPALIKRWMLGPPGWEMPVCEKDVREGGKYNWRWRSMTDKSEFAFHGVFRQVQPPGQIVHTQIFDPGTVGGDMGSECIVASKFVELDGATTVTTEIKYRTAQDMQNALATGMTDGMEMSYQKLDEVLRQ